MAKQLIFEEGDEKMIQMEKYVLSLGNPVSVVIFSLLTQLKNLNIFHIYTSGYAP